MTIIGNMGACAYGYWIEDDEILALWACGFNALEIGRMVDLHESEVANRLPAILEIRRARAAKQLKHKMAAT